MSLTLDENFMQLLPLSGGNRGGPTPPLGAVRSTVEGLG